MPVVPLIVLLLIFFGGLILFIRYILISNVSRATEHLEKLAEDYATRQKEIDDLLEKAKKDYQDTVTKARIDAENIKEEIKKRTQEDRDKLLAETKLKSEQIIEQAEKAGQSIRLELDNKIEKRAVEDACRLIRHALPERLQKELHLIWVKEFDKAKFRFDGLNLPKDINEVQIISAFPLDNEQKKHIHERLKEYLGEGVSLKEKLDLDLVAGFIITIGSIVVDGSLRYTIQNKAKELYKSQ